MTDSTDGAWKSPAKASALWRNKEPGTHSEKYGWKREEGRQRAGEKQGEGRGRRRCCLFNVSKCRDDPCLGKFGIGEGLRSDLPAAVYLLLCDVQPRSPDSDYPQTLLSFPFYLCLHGIQMRQTSGIQPSAKDLIVLQRDPRDYRGATLSLLLKSAGNSSSGHN